MLIVIFIVQSSMNFNASIYGNAVTGLGEEFGISAQVAKIGQMIFLYHPFVRGLSWNVFCERITNTSWAYKISRRACQATDADFGGLQEATLNTTRMPGKIVNGKEPNRVGTLSMRMKRFRWKAGCISWNPKVDSIALEAYMDMKLPETCKIAKSTKGFRSLYPHEIAEIHVINAGQCPNKARHGRKDFSDTYENVKLPEAKTQDITFF